MSRSSHTSLALLVIRTAFATLAAGEVPLRRRFGRQWGPLRIRDNGKGIDRKVLEQGVRQGDWGLPGVRERAKRIGARLKFWSEPGAGTEAELTVPAELHTEQCVAGRDRGCFVRAKV
jgi:signal transduction histidine kinase